MKIKLKNIAEGFGKLLLKGITGLDKETRQTAQKRLTICQPCGNRTSINTCKICKCYLPAKTTVMDEKCPIDKW